MSESQSILPLLAWDPTTGALTLDGARYLLLRPETLAGIHAAAERALGADGARALLIDGGSQGGARAATRYAGETAGLRALAERMAARGTALGWGRLTVESVEAERLVFTAVGSPFAQAHAGSDRPVCHILTGALLGLGRTALAPDAQAEETECTAAGAPTCRFEVRASP